MKIEGLPRKLNFSKKLLISAAGIVVVVVILFAGLIAGIFAAARAYGQDNNTIQIEAPSEAIAKAPVPSYSFVVIKPDKSGRHERIHQYDGTTLYGWTLQVLINGAYNLADNQIVGAPGWIGSEPFEIQTKNEKEVADYLKQLKPEDANYVGKLMTQKMLAERFQLKYHRETRELPAYVLTVAKGGFKLKPPKEGETLPEGFENNRRGMTWQPGPGQLEGRMVPFLRLVKRLEFEVKRPVVDKTGLSGVYDFSLKWDPQENVASIVGQNQNALPGAPEPSDRPSFSTAVQEQLGLKLTSQKAPVDVMVIDHVEKPSEN